MEIRHIDEDNETHTEAYLLTHKPIQELGGVGNATSSIACASKGYGISWGLPPLFSYGGDQRIQ